MIQVYPGKQENLKFYPTKTLSQKDTCISMFIVALFTIAKIWKQPKCPRVDKEGMVFLYTVEYCSAIKNNKKPCHLREHRWNKRVEGVKYVRERQILYDFTCMRT